MEAVATETAPAKPKTKPTVKPDDKPKPERRRRIDPVRRDAPNENPGPLAKMKKRKVTDKMGTAQDVVERFAQLTNQKFK